MKNTLISKNKISTRTATVVLVLVLVASLGSAMSLIWPKMLDARDAYLFAYPLITMHATGSKSESGVLVRKREFPDASFRRVVRPNVDTLYTSGFFHTSKGPWVFEIQENTERYEVMQFMDGWTNVFASIGTRTHGTSGGKYLIAGPDWSGDIEAGLTLIRSPTDIVWMIGRTQTNGPQDLTVVHRLQDGLSLRTYQEYLAQEPERKPSGSTNTRDSTAVFVRSINAEEFYTRLSMLLENNPPAMRDMPMMKRLAAMGIVPGLAPDWLPHQHWIMEGGRWLAHRQVKRVLDKERKLAKGWIVPAPNLGGYGSDYEFRAIVSMVGLGANKREDAIYLQGKTDHQGSLLNGSNHYQIHFPSGQTPPVNAFWSVTAYGSDHYLIDNPIGRYSLGDRDALTLNPDGSLDIWIQADPPIVEKRSNWLPVKRGESFALSTRIYWPKEIVLSGEWSMPPVRKVP